MSKEPTPLPTKDANRSGASRSEKWLRLYLGALGVVCVVLSLVTYSLMRQLGDLSRSITTKEIRIVSDDGNVNTGIKMYYPGDAGPTIAVFDRIPGRGTIFTGKPRILMSVDNKNKPSIMFLQRNSELDYGKIGKPAISLDLDDQGQPEVLLWYPKGEGGTYLSLQRKPGEPVFGITDEQGRSIYRSP